MPNGDGVAPHCERRRGPRRLGRDGLSAASRPAAVSDGLGARAGIDRIEAVMTDNHFSYKNTRAVADTLADLGARHLFIKEHCPWQNGKVERFNRTLQTEWAYAQIFTSNDDRTAALAPWLHTYNHHRRHHALGGHPPISRVSPT